LRSELLIRVQKHLKATHLPPIFFLLPLFFFFKRFLIDLIQLVLWDVGSSAAHDLAVPSAAFDLQVLYLLQEFLFAFILQEGFFHFLIGGDLPFGLDHLILVEDSEVVLLNDFLRELSLLLDWILSHPFEGSLVIRIILDQDIENERGDDEEDASDDEVEAAVEVVEGGVPAAGAEGSHGAEALVIHLSFSEGLHGDEDDQEEVQPEEPHKGEVVQVVPEAHTLVDPPAVGVVALYAVPADVAVPRPRRPQHLTLRTDVPGSHVLQHLLERKGRVFDDDAWVHVEEGDEGGEEFDADHPCGQSVVVVPHFWVDDEEEDVVDVGGEEGEGDDEGPAFVLRGHDLPEEAAVEGPRPLQDALEFAPQTLGELAVNQVDRLPAPPIQDVPLGALEEELPDEAGVVEGRHVHHGQVQRGVSKLVMGLQDRLQTQQVAQSCLRPRKAGPMQRTAVSVISHVDVDALVVEVDDRVGLVALGGDVDHVLSVLVRRVQVRLPILHQRLYHHGVPMIRCKVKCSQPLIVFVVNKVLKLFFEILVVLVVVVGEEVVEDHFEALLVVFEGCVAQEGVPGVVLQVEQVQPRPLRLQQQTQLAHLVQSHQRKDILSRVPF